MIELPCDWTVNRRPVASSSSSSSSTPAALPSAPPRTASAADAGAGVPTTAATTLQQPQQPQQPQPQGFVCDAHPLGPRTPASAGAFNEPAFFASGQQQGRVKALVLKQLTPTSEGSSSSSAPEELIDTESLLARLPYKRMLQDMFGGSLRGQMHDLTIPYVTRVYEESFMRERMHSSERECAKGAQCECMFIDRSQPFIGVEFLLPGEPMARTPHLCVLCCRATTQQLYYDVMFDKFEFPGTIQRFGNIHSQPGEYALDAMLIAVPTAPVHIMPLPIVSHQRNRYTVYVAGGIKRLRQSRVLFQVTLLRSADDGQ